MGFFDNNNDEIYLENADLDCRPQNEFVSKKEVEPIDEYLDPGEKIHYLFTGRDGFEVNGTKELENGATRTAITDKRVLIKAKTGMVFGTEYQSLRYDKIAGVNLKQGLVMTALIVSTSSNEYKVRLQQASGGSPAVRVGKEAVQFIREKMHEPNDKGNLSKRTSTEDPLDKLERLKDLKEDGTISEAEFESKKDELMDRI